MSTIIRSWSCCFLLLFFFYKLVIRIKKFAFNEGLSAEVKPFATQAGVDNNSPVKTILVYLLLLALLFMGIRGRLAIKSPIRWGTAFFSPYNFTNQLGLNPVYTFIRSWLDKKESVEQRFNFMSDDKAEKIVRQELNITDNKDQSPVSRVIRSERIAKKYHIVLVLMESMTAKNMTHFGNFEKLTPCAG
jgi:hypothetical protein